MRASRLLHILTILQAKGFATARDLASTCEVSLRTIYRDIDALSAAGVPVYAERGAEGGYRLLDGYRTRLNGMSQSEAEALFLAGLPEAAAQLGLAGAAAAAEMKLLAALPAQLRHSAEAMRGRFHLDSPGWFTEMERPAALEIVARAVWRLAPLKMRYRSGAADVERVVEPLGLVLKNAAWYLVARVGRDLRGYRVTRILQAQIEGGTFERPEAFDLAAFWRGYMRRYEDSLYTDEATLRVSPRGLRMLGILGRATHKRAEATASMADSRGWRKIRVPIESVEKAAWEFLRLGPEAEIVTPTALRDKIAHAADEMKALYTDRNPRPRPEDSGSRRKSARRRN